ncbi:MAG: HTH domain-containing protein [Oscillospiraceae bacterium]|nr:HTH domain-containing protein [Oscillospiraceae bacterium]
MNNQRSEDILEFVQKRIRQDGIAPSVREIMQAVGVRSTSTVHRYLHQLEKDGKLQIDSTKNRAIFVSSSVPEGIPVIGGIQKDSETLDKCNIIRYYDFLSEQKHRHPLFAFYLENEYPEFRFLKGDMLIAEKNDMQQYGKITVFLNESGELRLTDRELPSGYRAIGTVISMVRHY